MERKSPEQVRGAASVPRRGGKGFRHASETARRSVDQIAGRKGFAEADVLIRWVEIAGETLAATCRPVKIQYGANRAIGATMIVQTDSGHAPQVSHLAPTLIEKVNRYYGYRAISRIKVTQSTGWGAPRHGFAEGQAAFSGPRQGVQTEPPRPVREATTLARDIQTPELRAALTQLGTHVLSRGKTPKPGA